MDTGKVEYAAAESTSNINNLPEVSPTRDTNTFLPSTGPWKLSILA
jgi:hypothetical protein